MISVIAISGETYDLQTGHETPKSLILSNGLRTITIEVNDEVIREVILMNAEIAGAQPAPKRNVKSKRAKVIEEPPLEETVEDGMESAAEPNLGEAADAPDGDAEGDAGVDYFDTDRGVASV